MGRRSIMVGRKQKSKGTKTGKGFRSPLFIGLDAWVDNALYKFSYSFGRIWDRLSIFSKKFRVRGKKRFFVEIADEAMTLGLIGLTLFVVLGLSVYKATDGDWRAPDEFAMTMLDRHNNIIGQRGAMHAENIAIDDMPDFVIKAVLATEDRRFFEHWGIDFYGLSRALSQNMRANGVVQGGSTLTQQLAKNVFLSNERTFKRKVKEAYLALWLEANLSKKEILQLYLDRAYMGGGNFGIASAAKYYFGKDIRDVSLSEAAMLAGLFKAPGKYAPHINLPAARARANVVLSNLVDAGFMGDGEVAAARLHPATVVASLNNDAPDYFLDWIYDEVQKMGDKLSTRMLVVRTTLDLGLQKAAEESVEYHISQYGKQYRATQASTVIIENDGSVRAMVGGVDYAKSQFNRAAHAQRQAGSSFKPYVYAIAMEHGLTPQTVISDAPINWAGWQPRNYGRGYAGRVDLATALVKSLNTVPVRITYQYLNRSTKEIVDLVEAMGIESPISSHKTMVLGTSGMTPLDQATGFNVFANGGMAGNRHGFTQIMTEDGRILWDWQRDGEKPHRVMSEKATQAINSMLVQVPERGTGRRAALPMTRVAGKTGTSQNYRDAWFVGYTGNYSAAVWMGNDNFTPMSRLTGGVVPAMIWQRMMLYAHHNIELKPLYGVENHISNNQNIVANTADTSPSANLPQVLSPASIGILKEIKDALSSPPEFNGIDRTRLVSSDIQQIR
ncbi:transglycosylase domain-containing protein [Bartonella sp. HY328]|uniref:transglycosylase domain-containing protein n=1 Tax=unclassified Bartonella TaxID=2645622 RepID=UPI003965AFE5